MTSSQRDPGPVLITGANGFAGQHVLALLARAHPDLTVIAARTDITNRAEMHRLITETKPACCLHLAAIAAIGVARAEPDQAWNVNLQGTLNIAEALSNAAPQCRMIFISSADVYGASFRSGVALNEQAVLAPLNTYAATKAAADLALGAMAAENFPVIRLRAFNHTGAGQNENFVVAAFARQIALAEAGLAPATIRVGALTPERDFLDVRDVARAYVAAIIRAGELVPGTILNISSGVPRKIGDVLEALLKLSNVKFQVEEEKSRLRPSDIPRACGDSSLAQKTLGWQPEIPWGETLATVLDDWRRRVRMQAA